ncbi:MAG TPA: helix-turn-helix transcriptional regulator [Solirubrobacteraceae bacterium]|jgi:DNA-binding CsgD family transcriptional regulator|nr:helix-turn-helix transcriptional regulator [Solirubrobacteraceae bacterium]
MSATLGERHYRAVLDLVGEAHDAGDLDDFRSVLLPGLRRMVPAEFASYNEIHAVDGVLATIAEPDVRRELLPAWEAHAAQNPLVVRFARTRDGRAMRFSDVAAREELHRLALFREFYRPLGVAHQIAFTLPSPVPLTMGIALSRSPSRRDFSDEERLMLNLARPHLIQAYRNAQIRQRMTELLAAVQHGLDDDERGMLMAESDGTIAFASATALDLLEQLSGVAIAVGDALPDALAARINGRDGTALLALADDTLLVRRVRAGTLTVVLLEPSRRVLSTDALEGLGLTAREAQVLVAIARGRSTAETAEELTISARTVHKHLQRIHAKLGVSGRAQAIATAWAAAEAASAT